MIEAEKKGNHFPWNGNEMVEKAYERDNYKIIDMGRQPGRALIFFSGNGLYFPDTEEVFREEIFDGDRYEWEHVSKQYLIQRHYSKIIFLRDIYKQWYVRGINKRIDSVEKVIELVHELTSGLEVVTCGNSAGGYMAMLVGKAIGAKRIFSFSGQFSIMNQVYRAPLLSYYQGDSYYSKYYSLSTLMQERGEIFHFYPAYSIQDIEQMKIAEKWIGGIRAFAFEDDSHGRTVEAVCYEYLLTLDSNKLRELSKKYESRLIEAHEFSEVVLQSHDFFKRNIAYKNDTGRGKKGVYIWGTGIDGERCYRLFEKMGVEIIGIIDSYKKQTVWHGHKVIAPDELNRDSGIICVATRKYEGEIMEQIQKLEIEEGRYICFR